MADLVFSVKGESKSAARINVKARNFDLVVDEPPDLGGEDQGANPVEYILAGLVGCLNVMGHLVAKEMGFKIQNLTIDAEGPLNPEKLFGQPTDDRAGYKRIAVKLSVETDAEQETLDKWLAAVESRCPVSDNLGNPTPIQLSVHR